MRPIPEHTTRQKQFLALSAIVLQMDKHLANPYALAPERELDLLCIQALSLGCSYRQVADARGNDLTRQTIGNRYA